MHLPTWLDAHQRRLALQRPDFQLYGTAAGPAGAIALLGEVRRQHTTTET